MSVSLREVLDHSGYNVYKNYDDARWFLSKRDEIKELLAVSELVVEIGRLELDMFKAMHDDSQDEEDIAYYKKWIEYHKKELDEYIK